MHPLITLRFEKTVLLFICSQCVQAISDKCCLSYLHVCNLTVRHTPWTLRPDRAECVVVCHTCTFAISLYVRASRMAKLVARACRRRLGCSSAAMESSAGRLNHAHNTSPPVGGGVTGGGGVWGGVGVWGWWGGGEG